jgi:hypothetical protein
MALAYIQVHWGKPSPKHPQLRFPSSKSPSSPPLALASVNLVVHPVLDSPPPSAHLLLLAKAVQQLPMKNQFAPHLLELY